jgi:hypothetical protein
MVVKGLAISGQSLFRATYDGHLISIDAETGIANWNKTLVDWHNGYHLNVAPLVVKVILGSATNEEGANCWVAAYDVKTGNELWRFYTAPMSEDEPTAKNLGRGFVETWRQPHLGKRLVRSRDEPDFLGYLNPHPGWNGDNRNADDLCSDSVVAPGCRHWQAEGALPVHTA